MKSHYGPFTDDLNSGLKNCKSKTFCCHKTDTSCCHLLDLFSKTQTQVFVEAWVI